MAFCGECGSLLHESSSVCPTCGAVQHPAPDASYRQEERVEPEYEWKPGRDDRESEAPRYPRERSEGYNSYAKMSRSNVITLAENEKVVRRYLCSDIRSPRCSGYLTVTNKRLLFEGEAATSRITKEVTLDSVSGMNSYYGLNVNILSIIFGVILFVGGIGMLDSYLDIQFFGIMALLLGVLFVFFGFQRSFFLSVFSSKTTGVPIQLGQGMKSVIGNGAVYTLRSRPTVDTDRMLNELGALVLDLQELGDQAVEKWSKSDS